MPGVGLRTADRAKYSDGCGRNARYLSKSVGTYRPEPAVTSVTTGSAELTSSEPVPPLLTISSTPTSDCTAATTAPRRVASSSADACLIQPIGGAGVGQTRDLRFVEHDSDDGESPPRGALREGGDGGRFAERGTADPDVEGAEPQRGVHVDAQSGPEGGGAGRDENEVEVVVAVDHQRDPVQQFGVGCEFGDGPAVGRRVAHEDVVRAVPGEPDRLAQ